MKQDAYLLTALALAASALIGWPSGRCEGDEPKPNRSPRAELLLGESPNLERLSITVNIDGQPVGARWTAAIAKLCAIVDADGSGAVDKLEAARLPSAFGVRQMLWGRFVPNRVEALSTNGSIKIDDDDDGKITAAEVEDYYLNEGLSAVVVAQGCAPWSQALTESFLNADKQSASTKEPIEKIAWGTVLERIRARDLNGDEFISPAELLGEVAYPGVAASRFVPLADTEAANREAGELTNLAWSLPAPASDETDSGSSKCEVSFDAEDVSSTIDLHSQPVLSIQTAVDPGRALDMWRTAKRGFEAQFGEAADGDGTVTLAKLNENAPFRELQLLGAVADLDNDGSLTRNEFDRWLEAEQSLVESMVLVNVIDFGSGLFEFIDESHDGVLSGPELANAWDRLDATGALLDGRLHITRLPRQFRIVVSRGIPSSLLSKPLREGPSWFQASDRNGDGCLSLDEFPADDAAFQKLDANDDEVIDVQEAVKQFPSEETSMSDRDDQIIDLGRNLFFDRSLSSDGSTSCGECHQPSHGWTTPERFSRGAEGRVAQRHTPSLYNVGLQREWFWDGRAKSLEEQVLHPIENPNEMNQPIEALITKLQGAPEARKKFQAAGLELSRESLATALAAYCRTIEANDAPFDRFRAGDADALSAAAQRGHDLFFFRLQCSVCHTGENFTDGKYHNLGIGFDQAEPDQGRFLVTSKDEDRGAFKTPSLRNLAKTAPYMHDGRFATLDEVVDFYVRGGHFNPHLDQLMNVFPLSAAERADVVTFLQEGLTSNRDPAADEAAEFTDQY